MVSWDGVSTHGKALHPHVPQKEDERWHGAGQSQEAPLPIRPAAMAKVWDEH